MSVETENKNKNKQNNKQNKNPSNQTKKKHTHTNQAKNKKGQLMSERQVSTKHSTKFSFLESWRVARFENNLTQFLVLFSRSYAKPGRKQHGGVILSILLFFSKTKSYSAYISPDRGLQEQQLH